MDGFSLYFESATTILFSFFSYVKGLVCIDNIIAHFYYTTNTHYEYLFNSTFTVFFSQFNKSNCNCVVYWRQAQRLIWQRYIPSFNKYRLFAVSPCDKLNRNINRNIQCFCWRFDTFQTYARSLRNYICLINIMLIHSCLLLRLSA